MTISQLFYPVLSKSFTLLFISVVLTACSAEESFTDSTTGAGTGVVQGATPEPASELSLENAPVAILSASSSRINLGQSTTLSWRSTDADSCIRSGGWSGTHSTSGQIGVRPAVTSTYTLTCIGAGGGSSDSDSVTVTVNQPPPPPPPPPVPVVNLLVSSSSIDQGQSVTLSWSSTNATSCTASGGWSGARSTTGYRIVSPAATVNYILTCNGAGGSASASASASASVSVTVNAPPPAVPVVNLSVSSSSIDQGQSATLSWTSTNATSCTAFGGWSGARSTTGSLTISPAATSTYILSCKGAGGSAGDSVSVTVNKPPPAVPVVNLSVSSSSIDQGQSATLSWTSTNATSCTASGGWSGTRSTTGSQIVSPAATVNYILTCNGAASASASAGDSVSVTVNQPPPAVPVVNLSVSSSSIDQGQSATLSWTSTNATSCTASGGWSGTRSTTGSQIVSPAATVNYILTCNGAASASASASDSVSVTVNQQPPAVPVVNLSVSSSSIDKGQSATLSWTSTNATSCTASGGWSGTRNTAGIVSVSPAVTSTYTLSCNGVGGSASDSVTVTVNTPPQEQAVNLSWAAPVEREDGTPISLAEIAGYRVYYGTTLGSYPNQVDIADRNTMQVTLSNLATGTYYIVVTTYDMEGRESAFSQVVTKSI